MCQPVLRADAGRAARLGRPAAAALATGLLAAALLGVVTPAAADPGGDAWYRLRVCESGNNYRANTGNGFYGAYQFSAGTWRAYGGAGLPSNAAPAEQDYRAKLLYRARGWSPWPGCARRLGLVNDPAYGQVGAAPVRPAAQPVRPRVAHRPAPARIAPSRIQHRHVLTNRRHRSPRPADARLPIPRPERVAVWAAPDGGRWGRFAGRLAPDTAHRTVAVRLPLAAFGRQLPWQGAVRPA